MHKLYVKQQHAYITDTEKISILYADCQFSLFF